MDRPQTLRVRSWGEYYETHETRKLKKLSWLPVRTDISDDGYCELVSHPNGAAHLGVWLAILQIASRCKPRGTLVRGSGEPHTAETLALVARLSSGVFHEAIPRLLAIRWLEVVTCKEEFPEPAGDSPDDPGESSGRIEGKGMEETTTCASDNARESTSNPSKKNSDLTTEQSGWFAAWWELYWLRKSRKAAEAAFGEHVRSVERFEEVMAATRAQREEMLSRPADRRPFPATWLNAERWTDEVAQTERSLGDLPEWKGFDAD